MKLSFSALLVGVQSRVDHTVKVTLNTQEMGKDAGELMNISGQQVNVVFVSADDQVKSDDIPEAPTDTSRTGKTPSQLTRALLYRLWEAKGRPGQSFELYYSVRMETINKALADELDSLTT